MPQKQTGAYCALTLRGLPRTVRQQFKAYCARRGTTLTAMLIQMMRDKIAEDYPEEKKRRR